MQAGHKTGHWIWYIFPYYQGVRDSPQSRQYAISSLDEAIAYLRDPHLKKHLFEITRTVQGHPHVSAARLFGGSNDADKFQASMTMFLEAARATHDFEAEALFEKSLGMFFQGHAHPNTQALMKCQHPKLRQPASPSPEPSQQTSELAPQRVWSPRASEGSGNTERQQQAQKLVAQYVQFDVFSRFVQRIYRAITKIDPAALYRAAATQALIDRFDNLSDLNIKPPIGGFWRFLMGFHVLNKRLKDAANKLSLSEAAPQVLLPVSTPPKMRPAFSPGNSKVAPPVKQNGRPPGDSFGPAEIKPRGLRR